MNRQLAIEILSGDVLGTKEQTAEAICMAIEALSDVPDKNVGKWIQHPIYEGSGHYYYACSECDYRSWSQDNYCSVCGAKMEVENV